MQQTVLLTAIRGPDGLPKYGPVKMLLRWYRRCILYCSFGHIAMTHPRAQGGGSFTGPSIGFNGEKDWRPAMDDLVSEYLQILDAVPHHFQLHFMHGTEILGYKYPDLMIGTWWHKVYLRLVRDMHLEPEIQQVMDTRLSDKEECWRAANDEATQA